MKHSLYSILLFCFSSCSIFIENYEKDIFEEHGISPRKEINEVQCKEKSNFSIISENYFSQMNFEKLLSSLDNSHQLNFIDKIILWSLMQINLRPDLSSPSAKLQFLIFHQGKTGYLNSYTEHNDLYPYLKALETLSLELKSNYSLKRLALLLDQNLKRGPLVTKAFETFLVKKKNFIQQQPSLKKIYIRGDETLKENERIPILNFTQIVNLYYKNIINPKSSSYQLSDFLFTYKPNTDTQLRCNFDMDLYKKSLFLISDLNVQSHIFGLRDGENIFMAESSQDNTTNAFIPKTFLFKGSSNIRSASLCTFDLENSNRNQLWLFSSESRDPGQHLFHLLQYDVQNIKSPKELTAMLNFSRHLFLKNPVRLVIESRRSSHAQLSELLKLNVPIYNAKKLGKVWGLYSNEKRSDYILDERQQGHITCR